jgi:hypothetical protein
VLALARVDSAVGALLLKTNERRQREAFVGSNFARLCDGKKRWSNAAALPGGL